jgi:hypothetical protein
MRVIGSHQFDLSGQFHVYILHPLSKIINNKREAALLQRLKPLVSAPEYFS